MKLLISFIGILSLASAMHADCLTAVDLEGNNTMAPGSTTEITPCEEYDMVAGGTDIGADQSKDGCHFAYTALAGDFDVTVMIEEDFPRGQDGWSKAGLMARQTLDPSSPYVFAALLSTENERGWITVMEGRREYAANARTNIAGLLRGCEGPDKSVCPEYPRWVRLAREGSVFTGEYSCDGTVWAPIGSEGSCLGTLTLESEDTCTLESLEAPDGMSIMKTIMAMSVTAV